MATNFPASLDSLTNPTSSDSLNSPSHSAQHANSNDAIEALQAKVGVDSSAVTSSLDYRVGQLETGGGGMTVSSTAPSSPVEGDMWYDDTSGRTYVYYDDGSSQQWVEFGAPPSGIGKILQVASISKTDTFTTTSTSFVDVTGVSQTITPSSATNKVLVTVTGVGNVNDAGQLFRLNLVRDSTNIGQSNGGAIYNETAFVYTASSIHGVPFAMSFLDSPATTSATTYKLQLAVTGGTGAIGRTAQNANTGAITTITVMEVAA